MQVSACLIVKDEAAFLDGCLASICHQVDEIVVVDTGSSDNSVEIAARHGAKVLHQVWNDDFAAARNHGLDAAGGDWILYIDADERLSLPPGQRLADELNDEHAVAGRVRFFPTLNSTPYREYRLFRNDPRIRFKGAMHETILPDLEQLRAATGDHVVDSAATLTHFGYEGDLAPKFRRNLPWLRQGVLHDPGRAYYWFDLARSLSGLGESDEAIELAQRGLQIALAGAGEPDRAIGSCIADLLAALLQERGDDPLPTIELGLSLKPGQPRLMLLKAQRLLAIGRLEEARQLLAELCSIDVDTFIDPVIGYDRSLFTRSAPHFLGVTLLRLGRVSEASGAFSRAAVGMGGDDRYLASAAALERAVHLG